ncbi:Hpt domain-containing protein [Massilia sp. CFBP9026]|uniref:Hpt domain-containing protein n=1 Tax=Massilia sp. CFBP9026 TaxID=3096536 RepID=UPI002A6AE7ED|nr:Hpt domain-containing protein [Massilia sp. CFBP9026]MDY0965210.1 Hpt domain-containing protein [Massilia sp. CFBP9026]
MAIDFAAGLERVMDDRALFLRVLGRFAGDYRDLAARLHAALDAGDAVLAHRIAHTLKGAAGMIEANQLRELALEVELAMKAGDAAPLALIAALDEELARVLAEVDALLAAPDAPTPAPAPASSPAACDDLARLRDMLDLGDGRAPDLATQLRPRLLASMGSEKVAAFDAALRRFDFENALALLEQAGRR